MIRLSVVIPCRNARATLPRALAALADQQIETGVFEVLVADDGSTDGSADLAESMRATLPVRVLRQPNRGLAATRNLGASQAHGEVLLFLDADVFARPTLLAAHLQRYSGGGELLAVQGRTIADPDTLTTHFMRTSNLMPDFTIRRRVGLSPFHVIGRNFSVSRAAFQTVGGFDEDFTEYGLEDVEFALRLRHAGAIIAYEPDALGLHSHPLSVEAAVARQRQNGRAAVRLWRKYHRSVRLGLHYEVHPAFLPLKWLVFRSGAVTWLVRAIRPWAERSHHELLLNEVYNHLLWQGYYDGVFAALHDGRADRPAREPAL
jgi:glycosyltransferase involved in cell wall biosynthesis